MLNEISRCWTGSSNGYDQCVKAQFRSKRSIERWKELLRKGLGNQVPLQVLDIGTGPGFFSILLSQMGHRVTAVDASEGMIKVVSRNFVQAGQQVQLYLGDAANLNKEKDEVFDVVVCRDVVWTLPDPVKAFGEWKRALKSGGKQQGLSVF